MQAEDFGMFDCVKLATSLYCEDIYGELIQLRKGKSGCVMELGSEPGTLIIEFKIGKGMRGSDYTSVEVAAECVEIEAKIGRRFSDPNPYLATALAIKNGTLK